MKNHSRSHSAGKKGGAGYRTPSRFRATVQYRQQKWQQPKLDQKT